jgi:multidrug efflux pump subunit AcrA (membrane-fusion protein)
MASAREYPDDVLDQEWLEFESLLNDLSKIAKSDAAFEPFVRSLLEKSVQILAAAGGAVWMSDGRSPLRMACQVRPEIIGEPTGERFHEHVLECARSLGDPLLVPPGETTIGGQTLENPTDFTLLLGPLKLDQDVVGLVEIFQRSTASVAALRGNRRMLGLVCELASDHLRRRELRELRDERTRSQQLDEFRERIHGSLDLQTVAYEIANAGSQYINCDRLSVAVRKGRRYDLIAVSGLDTINRRSNVVHCLQLLSSRVAQGGEAVWYDGESSAELAPQVVEALRQYADDAHPRMIGLVPLRPPTDEQQRQHTPPLGVLIVEQFNSLIDAQARERVEQVGRQSSIALVNALRYRALPTLPFARRRTNVSGQPTAKLAKSLAAIAGLALLASLFFIHTNFDVYADGELQPEQQQHVFAPLDGQVASIAVQHGGHVEANAVLLEMRSPELELESQRVQGEFETTQKRLSSIQSSLLEINAAKERDDTRFNQLAAEQQELQQVQASQQEQLTLLRRQRDQLVVHSPMTGTITTWDLEQLLLNRPVQRGQQMLNVANLEGPWVAELKVPDAQIGHVLDTKKQSSEMTASFQLATNRGADYKGTLHHIASRTEVADDKRSVVRVTLDVDKNNIPELRPGATVHAKIHCGQKSLAYVWFHEVVETALNWFRF